MIFSIVRTGFMNLRRDRGALTLSFIVPIAFFSIFAGIFGSRSGGTDPIRMAVVDEDHSELSRRLVEALLAEGGLRAQTGPAAAKGAQASLYDARTAEAAVRSGDLPVAVIIPKGFGESPIQFGPSAKQTKLQILNDSSDPIAAQVVYGLIQKSAMVSLPDAMASEGAKYLDRVSGGLTSEQRARVDRSMQELRVYSESRRKQAAGGGGGAGAAAGGTTLTGLVSADIRDVVGENKKNPLVAFYAAGIGVMFLLFSASAAGGAILDESESGTLDRILSSRVTMSTLLLGKLLYSALLGISQLTVMFLWGALAFKVELFRHLGGFFLMATVTAFASAGLGLALAASCKTRAQLGALTTLVVLVMSALGGSMVPRFIMPEFLQKIGLVTFNAWALDGFTKIFWREEPVTHVWPQVLVLVGAATLFFAIARRLARRWEVA
ncbi:MAG: ABC transporter permease [Candidatus Eisenbacteria bacterium]|uniref:ABC transporter permease n=1 Tax=Eiseniibacteriota bacterium TaxID=2212470 RepID=A0A538T170_UNCEI|nr:MAG: ABC transporter permease [Candidatus Eisenbacteria bacterium]